MKLTLTADLDKAITQVNKRGKTLLESSKKALLITAFAGIDIIQDRTSQSRSYKGSFFKKYNPKYKKFRQEKGRGSRPDLQFTGQMFSSMTAVSNSRQAEIFFTRPIEGKKAEGNDKKRPFFGFSRPEKNQLTRVFERNLK